MIYIDDYNSKVISNGPPKKEDKAMLADTKNKWIADNKLSFGIYLG